MSGASSVYVKEIARKFFTSIEGCLICYDSYDEYDFPDCCYHSFCNTCIAQASRVNHLCPLCGSKYSKIIPYTDYFKGMCELIMKDRETFHSLMKQQKHLYSPTFCELMDYLNAIKDEGLDILRLISNNVKADTSAHFKAGVQQIISTVKLGREPSAIQKDLLNELCEMDANLTSHVIDFIVHMNDECCQILKDLCEAQREIKMGHLLKVLALCDNYKGIPEIVTILRRYEPSRIARVMTSLFKLPYNGFNETVALLKYHETLEERKSRAFFDHYYHNQWINHAHYDDETVMDIVMKSGKVARVYGNDYDRKGRLLYTGYYKDKKYNGHGKQFTEDQNYYEGEFSDGKRNGVFELKTERCVLRRDTFADDKRNGECLEFFNDGKTIRQRCGYKNDKKNGIAYEMTGSGSLLFIRTYRDDVPVGEGYEYLGPSVCRKGTYRGGQLCDSRIMYHPNPNCRFDYEHPVYDEAYYKQAPVEFGILRKSEYKLSFSLGDRRNEENDIHRTIDDDYGQEIFINNEVLALIKKEKEKYPDCLKPGPSGGCKRLIIMGNGIDVIDFNDLWNILLDLTMVCEVCIQNMRLFGVHMDIDMEMITCERFVFHRCYFDAASFLTRLSVNSTRLLFIDCWNMKQLLIKKSVYSKGTRFVVKGCPDLEDIQIEDYNFAEVPSFTLDSTMRSLKNLVLGAKVFSLCTDIYLRGLPCLETIVFGKDCCKNSIRFCACELRSLKSVTFGDFTFTNGASLQFLDTPNLEAITMGGACFKAINTISFSGAKKFTTFNRRMSIRKNPSITYEDSNPDGLVALKTWFK